MKLWEVTNGYIGESYVRCLVVAETMERAIELAKVKYRANSGPEFPTYPDQYYEKLTAEVVFEDLTSECASEVTDG